MRRWTVRSGIKTGRPDPSAHAALAFGGEQADHLERERLETDQVVDRILRAEELLADGSAEDADCLAGAELALSARSVVPANVRASRPLTGEDRGMGERSADQSRL
jgi:hypothetical protein